MTQNSVSKTPIVILFLIIGLVIGFFTGYLSFRNTPEGLLVVDDHPFDKKLGPGGITWTDVPTARADSNLDAYVKNGSLTNLGLFHAGGKPHGIVHEPESAIKYDTGFFPNFVATHTILPNGYKWSIGLYPEVCRETMRDGKPRPRLCIYMIPTMRNLDVKNYPNDILDYDSIKNTPGFKLYYQTDITKIKDPALLKRIGLDGGTGNFIYDQGTIFP